MSVINQMLKDLDERNEPQSPVNTVSITNSQTMPVWKVSAITAVISISLVIAAVVIWNMYTENKALKQQVAVTINAPSPAVITQTISSDERETEKSINKPASKTDAQPIIPIAKKPQAQQTQTLVKQTSNKTLNITEPAAESVSKQITEKSTLASVDDKKEYNQQQNRQHNKQNSKAQSKENNLQHQHLDQQAAHEHPHATTDKVLNEAVEQPTSSLTISRKKLTPKQLASQKMQRAERAVAEGKLEKAESLLEEILMIMPEHHVARKQLAALWYGRKSYQPALNLLQQGIVIDSSNTEFRLMKARIYLAVNQTTQAFDVLNGYQETNNIEYLALLANAAQQIGNIEASRDAYLALVQLSPQNGRFWLGLAVAYDSAGEFIKAVQAYESAIFQGGLSKSALTFAKQRKDELGE